MHCMYIDFHEYQYLLALRLPQFPKNSSVESARQINNRDEFSRNHDSEDSEDSYTRTMACVWKGTCKELRI